MVAEEISSLSGACNNLQMNKQQKLTSDTVLGTINGQSLTYGGSVSIATGGGADVKILRTDDEYSVSLSGTGTVGFSGENGIVTSAIAKGNVITRSNVSDIVQDINLLMGKVEEDGFDVTGFAGDISNKSSLRGLRDQNGGLLFQPSLTADTPSTLYAQPINYVKNGSWDKTQALLVGGDFSQAVYAIRQDMTYKILDQAVISDGDGRIIYNLAQQDMVALRCVMRLGWQLPNPVTALNSDGTTRYPFAVLAPQAVSGGGE